MRIDAHQHFWEIGRFDTSWMDSPELAPLRRDFLPGHLNEEIARVDIDRTVFVQTQHNLEENRWVLALADEHDFIAGVVGWVDLASEAVEDQLTEFTSHPKFVGIRHITHDESDDRFILREDIGRGLKVLEKHQIPFDLLFFVKHLGHAKTLAAAMPDLPLVIDHLAKPEIAAGNIEDWAKELAAAALHPNLYCKLSGLVTEAGWDTWKAADLMPYIETALEAFGADRCMFGSDWPVCTLAANYQEVHAALLESLSSISEDERSMIFGGTAARFYGIDS